MKFRAVLACLLWGSAFAGAKIGFQYADPILLSGMRFTLAGLLLVPVMVATKTDLRGALRHWPFMLLFALVQTFLQYGLFFMGLDKVPAALSAIIIGAGPLFVALMAHIALPDDRMTVRKTAAIALGLSGVVFISLAGGGLGATDPNFWGGVGLLVLSNVIGSYTNIMVVRRKGDNISPVALTSFANFTGGLMLLAASLLFEHPVLGSVSDGAVTPPPLMFWVALVWLAIIPAGAFSLWYGLLQRPGVKVSELNVWKFLVPVTGCVLAWLLLPDESPDLPSIVGITIIVGALWLLQGSIKKRRASR
jgi:drug/metabolite transporter (DMT)-like permease